VLVTVAVLGVLATATVVLAQQLTPHFPAWERYFTVSWQTFERQGRPFLSGYVTSQYGAGAGRVQLLIDALDGSNRVVAQRVEWLAGDVAPFSRRYFEVPAPQPASTYRVSVFAFDFVRASRRPRLSSGSVWHATARGPRRLVRPSSLQAVLEAGA